jgi:O-acetyl-ADP-ribose deacetylase (regulator of RNase III)
METSINNSVIRLVAGDITKQTTRAIVNAANETLLGGGGVDGAIHQAGGPAILEECRKLGGCATGDAKITTGGNLPARYVIHTVGPVWHNGVEGEDVKLGSAYYRSLEVAEENHITALAFPSISTGAYRFPLERAAAIALHTVRDYLQQPTVIREVVFVLFSAADYTVYEAELIKITTPKKAVKHE